MVVGTIEQGFSLNVVGRELNIAIVVLSRSANHDLSLAVQRWQLIVHPFDQHFLEASSLARPSPISLILSRVYGYAQIFDRERIECHFSCEALNRKFDEWYKKAEPLIRGLRFVLSKDFWRII